MKNINKFLLSIAILLNFSIVNAEEIQEVMSLDDISREIIGERVQTKKSNSNKENKINKKVDEKIEEKDKTVEIANINTEKENKKVEEEVYVEDEPEQKIDKASIVDVYDKKVIDKIAYKKGSESTVIISTPAFTKALTLSIVSGAIPTAAPHLNFPKSSLQAFGYCIKLSISFIVINPFKYPFSSVIGNFSILFANKISFACSNVVPTGAVISPSFVIISPTG